MITIYLSSENPKRIEWEFSKVMTTLYNNRSILTCQNSDYIINEWWYLSNQEWKNQNRRKPEYLVDISRIQKSRCVDV